MLEPTTTAEPAPAATAPAAPLSYTPSGIVRATGLTRTRVFGDIAAGKLRAKKAGRQTIVMAPELQRYLLDLPDRKPRNAQTAA